MYNTYYTRHATPILEIQHDNLHLIYHPKPCYEFFKHNIDYYDNFTKHKSYIRMPNGKQFIAR